MHVVPHRPGHHSVTLWIQAEMSETGWSLLVTGATLAEPRRWTPASSRPHPLPNVAFGTRDTRIWLWTVDELSAGADFEVRFVGDVAPDEDVAATFRTLPESLATPFTVLLGSCYSEDSDLPGALISKVARASAEKPALGAVESLVQRIRHAVSAVRGLLRTGPVSPQPRGHVSRQFQKLYESRDHRPDLKILVGDQVYLDSPWYQFLGLPMPQSAVKRHVSATYSRTWEKLSWMLSHGVNICVSDDHEFWNDFPYKPPLLTVYFSFWPQRFRRMWELQARSFLQWVQLSEPMTRFAIGSDRPELEFLVVDTRMNRGSDPVAPGFMAERDFASLLDWIHGLRAPGVLAVGQPVFAAGENRSTGLITTDHNLASFTSQYDRLCEALLAAPHDVMILCGDVHFGRVLEVEVPRSDREAPMRIIEIISSPMALVKHAGATFDCSAATPGQRFPFWWSPSFDQRVPGVAEEAAVLRDVRCVGPADRPCPDHYTTLAFARGDRPGQVRVDVTAYSLEPDQDDLLDSVLLRCGFVLDRHAPAR